MKPKCKPQVHYAATEDGVYFRTWNSEFVMKGTSIYQWVEQVLPYLTGERTLDELVAPLPEAQEKFVHTLVQELVRRGVVVDASDDREIPVREAEQVLYKQSLLFLEDQAANGRELFRRFRDGQVLLSGGGLSFRALVRSLLKMGLRAPVITESDDAELVRLVEAWQKRDEALSVTWLAQGSATEWLCGLEKAPQFCVHVSDAYDEEVVRSLLDACAKRSVPALVGTELCGLGVVGPLLDEAAVTSWDCLLDRFVPPNERAEEADSPIFPLMIGNIAALEAFQAIAGLQGLNVRDQAALIDPRRLESSHHRLWASPLRTVEKVPAEQGMERFMQVQEAVPVRKFLAELEVLKDERFGVLNVLHPGDLMQIPLAHARAVVRLPGLAQGRALEVIACGEEIDAAMELATREALTAYARLVEEQISGSPLSADAVWSHGRDVQEWLGRGTLLALAGRTHQRGASWQELAAADLAGSLEGTYLKMLTQRYGLQVRLFALDLGVKAAHQVRVWFNRQWVGSGIGRTRREALKAALLQALSACQLQENHPERMAAAALEAAELPTAVQQAECDTEAESLGWAAWNLQVQEQLLLQGLKIVPTPWLADTAPLAMGVLVGQIAIQEVGER